MNLVCPACGVTNRVREERLQDNPVCGSCRAPLMAVEPASLGDTILPSNQVQLFIAHDRENRAPIHCEHRVAKMPVIDQSLRRIGPEGALNLVSDGQQYRWLSRIAHQHARRRRLAGQRMRCNQLRVAPDAQHRFRAAPRQRREH